ncbi:MAG: carbamoyltransferase [Phycisphaerae bacterium]|nr:carbamoyltransferase [Phycisphaerae bacterium]NUQ44491.1 carbamoyltransferase [Phycisphaerae bacterium]
MRILGIVSHTHDTGIALLHDGVPDMVIEEERLNRQKKTMKFPRHALDAAFRDRGLTLNDVDYVTMPWHIPTLIRTLGGLVLRRFPSSINLLHLQAHPSQRNRIVMGTRLIARRLRKHFPGQRVPPIIGIGHHNSHAASAFFVCPFDEAAVLIMDGYGDDAATSLYIGRGNRLERRWRNHILDSLGVVYTVVTEYLGFRGNHDEGKVMGLAAYGEPTYVDRFRDVFHLNSGGGYRVNMDYFLYDRYGQARPFRQKFFEVFGPPRRDGEDVTQRHKDIARGLQAVVEDVILHVVRGVAKEHRARNLCLAGGVALNCVTNARILTDTDIERIWIPPNPSDTGAVLGSALWQHHQTLGRQRTFELKHAFYGCGYSDDEAQRALESAGLSFEKLDGTDLLRRTAAALADGRIVAWYQGRFEMGPRALGNRSILADPRRADMKDTLNRRVKHRESFRPFAPAVLVERVGEFFEINQPDPFMTIAPRVRPDKAHLIPAVVHADGTGRIQTIDREANPRYYELISEFDRLTGVPIVLNTSFNRQEPIVARPAEAVSCFLRTDMDVLVLGDFFTADRNADSIRRAHESFSAAREAYK